MLNVNVIQDGSALSDLEIDGARQMGCVGSERPC